MSDTQTIAQLTRIGDAVFTLKNAVLAGNTKLDAIAELLGKASAAPGPAPAPGPTPGPAPGPTPGPAPGPIPIPIPAPPIIVAPGLNSLPSISVGPTQRFVEMADAWPYLAPGGVMTVDDGRYLKCFGVDKPGCTIQSASGNPLRCYIDGEGGHGAGHDLYWRKAGIHIAFPVTIIGIGVRNAGSPSSGDNYSNEAGFWLGDSANTAPWLVTLKRIALDNCGDGIFVALAEPWLDLVVIEPIVGSVAPNGMNAAVNGGGHAAHDFYIGSAHSVDVSGGYFYGSAGHAVKTRVVSGAINVHDNPLMCQDGGRVLDACEGGAVSFTGNTVWTRADRTGQIRAGLFGNANCIGYCDETTAGGAPGMTMSGNTLHISRNNATIWAANASRITSSGDTVNYYGSGSLNLQGTIIGLAAGSAPPGGPASPPPLPSPPVWASR